MVSLAPAKTRVVRSRLAPGAMVLASEKTSAWYCGCGAGKFTEPAFVVLALARNDCGRPIFVGIAEPAALRVASGRQDLGVVGLLGDLGVVDFRVVLVGSDDADETFEKHGVAGGLRRPLPGVRRVGKERDRLLAVVLDGVGEGEHVILVDGNLALEDQPSAIVIGQGDWRGLGQPVAIGLPHRIGIGQFQRDAARGDIAEVDEIAVRRAGGRQQHDVRAVRVGRLAILLQRDVVEPRALERHAAEHFPRVDDNARALRQGVGAAQRLRRGGGLQLRGAGLGGICRAGRTRLAARGELLDLALRLARLIYFRRAVEMVPADDDQERQRHGEDEIFLILLHVQTSCLRSAAGKAGGRLSGPAGLIFAVWILVRARASSPRNSSKGAVRASIRATTT